MTKTKNVLHMIKLSSSQKKGASPAFFACVSLTFAECLAKIGASFTAPPECDKKMRQDSDVLFDWGRWSIGIYDDIVCTVYRDLQNYI